MYDLFTERCNTNPNPKAVDSLGEIEAIFDEEAIFMAVEVIVMNMVFVF